MLVAGGEHCEQHTPRWRLPLKLPSRSALSTHFSENLHATVWSAQPTVASLKASCCHPLLVTVLSDARCMPARWRRVAIA